jgi:hypothetical protein
LTSFKGSPVKSSNDRDDASGKNRESKANGIDSADVTRSIAFFNGLPQSLHNEKFRGKRLIVTGSPISGRHVGEAFQVSLTLEVRDINAWCRFRGEQAKMADREFGKFGQLTVQGRFVDVEKVPVAFILDDCEVISTNEVPMFAQESKRVGDSFSERSILPKKGAGTAALAKDSYSKRAVNSVQHAEFKDIQFLDCKPQSRLDVLQAIIILAANFSGEEATTNSRISFLVKRIGELPQSMDSLEKHGWMGFGLVVLPNDWESVFGEAPKIQQRTEILKGMTKPSSFKSWQLKCNDGLLTFTGNGIMRTQPPRLHFTKVYNGHH